MTFLALSHPERREECGTKKFAYDRFYLDGLIGDETYVVSLLCLRFTREEALEHLCRLRAQKALNRGT